MGSDAHREKWLENRQAREGDGLQTVNIKCKWSLQGAKWTSPESFVMLDKGGKKNYIPRGTSTILWSHLEPRFTSGFLI